MIDAQGVLLVDGHTAGVARLVRLGIGALLFDRDAGLADQALPGRRTPLRGSPRPESPAWRASRHSRDAEVADASPL